MGRRRRRSLLTRKHAAPRLSTPAVEPEADGEGATTPSEAASAPEERDPSTGEVSPASEEPDSPAASASPAVDEPPVAESTPSSDAGAPPDVEAAEDAAGAPPPDVTPAPPVRFVDQGEMLLGWRPRRSRPGARPFITIAELRLASSVAALATVMLIVGFVGLVLVYLAWPQ